MAMEKKVLLFAFDMHNIQFNYMGQFHLKISIQSSFNTDHSAITVAVNDGEPVAQYEAQTDQISQDEDEHFYEFKNHKFIFSLPRGYCKNDNVHDVYLLVQAFEVQSTGGAPAKLVGEAKFAIYPRTNAPRIDLTVDRGDDLYHYTDIMTLLRTVSTEDINMHCGRIKFTASLKEDIYAKDETPEPEPEPSPIVVTPPPPPPPPKPPSTIDLPPSTVPPSRSTPRTTVDSPPLSVMLTPPPGDGMLRHVSRPGAEDIVVIFHGATSLPPVTNGKTPIPFAIAKTKTDEDFSKKSPAVTHSAKRPTYSPTWEEMVTLEVEDIKGKDEVLVLTVADQSSKESLVNYKIPLNYLIPFHQYHLELIMPAKGIPNGIRLYCTIIRKTSSLPRDLECPNYVALEFMLRQVQRPFINPSGPLIGVARVVPDCYNYELDMLGDGKKLAGIGLTTVTFPSPHPSAFNVPEQHSQGYPQITMPGRPEVQPVWNHPFLFTHKRDKATLFTPSAALIIEYYSASTVMTDIVWSVRNPVGYSILSLDEEIYKQLITSSGRNGFKLESLPIQGTKFETTSGHIPSVGCSIKLITTERPTCMAEATNEQIDSLPRLLSDDILEENLSADEDSDNGARGRNNLFVQYKLKRGYDPNQDLDRELPRHDAMDTILPEYQYIFMDPPGAAEKPKDKKSKQKPQDLNHTQYNLLDHQMKELDRYRLAVQKMGQDIIQLRQTVRDLEGANSTLRRDINHYSDSTRYMLDSSELDGLTKPELVSRYVALKQSLQHQTGDLSHYKDRVQHLQNELIKKNEQEKEYIKLSNAHKTQQQLVQRLQEIVQREKKLKETMKNQENVIVKMETMLSDKLKTGKQKKDETQAALLAENARLRGELEISKKDKKKGGGGGDDQEKLELYQMLDKAEGRIMSLEKQLAENARKWGKEKNDLMVKLSESEHGFNRSQTNAALNDYADRYDSRRYTKSRAKPHSKLKPLAYS
ncbi:coiled-coil domain-containing protein 33-like isoform X2 [Tubulanus polymorphus]|uniref:coiled-coil domain-containing protein 33-like isoform X2 n=1 Tax=Tubulanus polymorphus TaxID=672921 RepID=UPI003DA333AD